MSEVSLCVMAALGCPLLPGLSTLGFEVLVKLRPSFSLKPSSLN